LAVVLAAAADQKMLHLFILVAATVALPVTSQAA
jgi:hypothetical protein